MLGCTRLGLESKRETEIKKKMRDKKVDQIDQIYSYLASID